MQNEECRTTDGGGLTRTGEVASRWMIAYGPSTASWPPLAALGICPQSKVTGSLHAKGIGLRVTGV